MKRWDPAKAEWVDSEAACCPVMDSALAAPGKLGKAMWVGEFTGRTFTPGSNSPLKLCPWCGARLS